MRLGFDQSKLKELKGLGHSELNEFLHQRRNEENGLPLQGPKCAAGQLAQDNCWAYAEQGLAEHKVG